MLMKIDIQYSVVFLNLITETVSIPIDTVNFIIVKCKIN